MSRKSKSRPSEPPPAPKSAATSRLRASGILATLLLSVTLGMWWRSSREAASSQNYRIADEILQPLRSEGWNVGQAPQDGRRYRVCGSLVNDSSEWVMGSFHSADGRQVRFSVPRPNGQVVRIEGLAPEGGGPLTYVVLTQPAPGSVAESPDRAAMQPPSSTSPAISPAGLPAAAK
ncbi:MAG: hypothetical protein ACK5Q5_01840 [Planctomycetaceae bacterium]